MTAHPKPEGSAGDKGSEPTDRHGHPVRAWPTDLASNFDKYAYGNQAVRPAEPAPQDDPSTCWPDEGIHSEACIKGMYAQAGVVEAVRPAREGSDLATAQRINALAFELSAANAARLELEAANKALAEERDTFSQAEYNRAAVVFEVAIEEATERLRDDLAEVRAAARVMLEALRKYGRHTFGCETTENGGPCDCGFGAAIKAGEDVLREEKAPNA